MADNLGFGANPYLDDAVNATLGDMARGYNMMQAPTWATMNRNSGSFGNSGLQQAEAYDREGMARQMANAATNMRYGDYWNNQNFNKSVYDTTFNQQQQMLGNLLGMNQQVNGANAQDVSNAGTIQNTPMNYWNQFANTANGIGQGFGTATQQTTGTGSPLLGAIGGWQLGGALGKAWGNGGGGWGGTSLSSFFGGNGTSGD